MADRIEEVLELYQQAVLEKDVDLMLSLYCDDVLMYDVAGQWSLSGKKDLTDMVTAWFQEIGPDRVEVSYSNLEVQSSETCAFAYFDTTFSKVGFEQSVTDRFTLGLIYELGWKIKHQHASHPMMITH
ncbi:TPA: nuclear transport factor 2 family protein [Streptococcus suis]|nr:nuclear transport factor 2 family protein [Streptococcus suis]HEL1619570.1 nuclear transport factor 2 family protein [Streptococcus suis]HEL1810982.1 nuclear transport factor 2 family protein [Streptococcus suis]